MEPLAFPSPLDVSLPPMMLSSFSPSSFLLIRVREPTTSSTTFTCGDSSGRSSDPFPSRMRGSLSMWSMSSCRHPRTETLMEEELLGPVASQRECPHPACPGLLPPTHLHQECPPHGVK